MRGLTSLTEPDDEDSVGAVVDVAVIGARGDGKTQFIVHAIRTLRAYAPLLEGAEHQYNRDVLQVVMSAREPRPEATPPGVVPHYVFRIRPDSLLSQVGLPGRLALYARVAGLMAYVFLAVLNAGLIGALLTYLRDGPDPLAMAAAGGLLVVGLVFGTMLARRQFIRRGDIEIVFWDVAGEHVYSSSAADYYSFLSALVRQRRQRASARRSYAFAPVLICNPISLGTRTEGSPYARLRQLMPLFASLNEPLPRTMIAINRWTVVKEVCTPDANRDEQVAVVARARVAPDAEANAEDADEAEGAEDADAAARGPGRRASLPVVERDVVRKHCLDAEDGAGDGEDRDIYFSYLRYDAGIQCEFHERPWKDWDDMPSAVTSRWRAPSRSTPDTVLEYVYEDGPGSFRGEVRRSFLHWLAGLAFHKASYRATRKRKVADVAHEVAEEPIELEVKQPKAKRLRGRSQPPPVPVSAPEPEPELEIVSEPGPVAADAESDPHEMWRPRPLSAEGLEDFSRGTITSSLDEPPSSDNGADQRPSWDWSDEDGQADEPDIEIEAGNSSEFERESTEPGIGPSAGGPSGIPVSEPHELAEGSVEASVESMEPIDEPIEPIDEPMEPIDEPMEPIDEPMESIDELPDKSRAKRHGDTLPMPGGFGSSGT